MTAIASKRALWVGLAAVMGVALIARVLLMAGGTVSFHSDEAVVGLMARGILQGDRPTFFYGQAYMGSLDPWLVALGFAALGESVWTIHLVQSVLFLGVVAASYGAAYVLSGRVLVAAVAGLTLAVPTVLVALYTTATLGGYNETLLLGALIVLIGFPIHSGARSAWRWALIGVLAGLGWWTNALIAVYLLPVALLLLVRLWQTRDEGVRLLVGPALALLGFALGSAPWWVFALEHDLAPLRFLFGSSGGGFASAEVSQPFGIRLIGLAAFGLPAALGLRFPWSPEWFAPVVGAAVVLIYAVGVVVLIRRRDVLKPGGRALVLGMMALLGVVFLLSRFSNDPTGRYFLPLTLPLGVVLGGLVWVIYNDPRLSAPSPSEPEGETNESGVADFRPISNWEQGTGDEGKETPPAVRTRGGLRSAAALGVVALVLGYHAAGQIAAAQGPQGITTQFNVAEHIPVGYDDALIEFLRDHDLAAGYASYWSAFRLAFLSGGDVTFSAALPPRDDLDWTPFYERIPAYRAAADAAPPVFLTAGTPAVDAELERIFAEAGVTYSVQVIGPYRVYFGFAPPERMPRPPLAFRQGS
ncbi:MAG TPA: hypothetical protein VER79_00020 [Candidatus Limnocylindrales bacterium]|nr:hypothetical protein [Candidatus Limnocylindrales bacterium]